MNKEKILIIGTGAQAKYAAEIFNLLKVETVGLLAISQNRDATWTKDYDVRVLGGLELLDDFKKKGIKALVTNSNNKEKESIVGLLKNADMELTNAIHPGGFIASTAQIGTNVIINAGPPFCSNSSSPSS